MKRLLLMIAASFMLLVALPLGAAPMSDLADLARYFPEDTAFYTAFRTDDAFIDELDALLDYFEDNLDDGSLPPVDLRAGLDDGVRIFGPRASFDSTIRPWLGDTAAVGILSVDHLFDLRPNNDDEVPVLLVLSLRDRDEAETFIETFVKDMDLPIERAQEGDFTVYRAAAPGQALDMVVAINDDVLFYTTNEDWIPFNSDFRALDDNSDFNAVTAMLPAEDYNAMFYFDFGSALFRFYRQVSAFSLGDEGMSELLDRFGPLYEDYPTQAVGLTVLDGRALTIDVAQSAIDYEALAESVGMALPLAAYAPVDLALAEAVPGDAPFVIFGTGFGSFTSYLLDFLALATELGAQMDDANGLDDLPAFARDITAGDVRAFIDLAFAGFTGLNLSEDVLPYLDGTAAVYGRVLPLDRGSDLTYDTAAVFAVEDEDAGQAMIDALRDALDRYEADYDAQGGALILPWLIRDFLPEDTPRAYFASPLLDFAVGFEDGRLALGTREAALFSLNGDGESLADSAAFADAQAYFLDGAQQVYYLDFDGLADLAEMAVDFVRERDRRDMEATALLFRLFASASITNVVNDDNSALSRIVLTLDS